MTTFQNAFSERLGCLGFNLFAMLVVDLLHEFELGVWKALFAHLLHILSAAAKGNILVHELDCRLVSFKKPDLLQLMDPLSYRLISTFSRNTIRKFTLNTSEIKKMAVCNFEDILQVRPHILFNCSQ
jgi:hypothetical protein